MGHNSYKILRRRKSVRSNAFIYATPSQLHILLLTDICIFIPILVSDSIYKRIFIKYIFNTFCNLFIFSLKSHTQKKSICTTLISNPSSFDPFVICNWLLIIFQIF